MDDIFICVYIFRIFLQYIWTSVKWSVSMLKILSRCIHSSKLYTVYDVYSHFFQVWAVGKCDMSQCLQFLVLNHFKIEHMFKFYWYLISVLVFFWFDLTLDAIQREVWLCIYQLIMLYLSLNWYDICEIFLKSRSHFNHRWRCTQSNLELTSKNA